MTALVNRLGTTMLRAKATGRLLSLGIWAAVLLIGAYAHPGWSQSAKYPSGPVTLMVPYGPGGGNDTVARILADLLSKHWGVPVVVENRPGAGATIGVTYFLRNAKPDGQTLMVMSTSSITTATLLQRVRYSFKDVEPLVRITNLVEVLVVNKDFPAKTAKEFMELARQKPETITMSHGALGSQGWMAMRAIADALGVQIVGVPVSSGASSDQITMVAGGHVPAAVTSLTGARPFLASGSVRALALVQEHRDPSAGDIPTLLELGYNVRVGDEVVLYGIPGTPEPIRRAIDQAVSTVMKDARFVQTLANVGLRPNYANANSVKPIIQSRYETGKRLLKK